MKMRAGFGPHFFFARSPKPWRRRTFYPIALAKKSLRSPKPSPGKLIPDVDDRIDKGSVVALQRLKSRPLNE